MNATETTCRICGAPLITPVTGRPPTYCGASCRKFADHGIRRADREIERIAREVSATRAELATATRPVPTGLTVRLDAWEYEQPLAEERLQMLLGGADDEGRVEIVRGAVL